MLGRLGSSWSMSIALPIPIAYFAKQGRQIDQLFRYQMNSVTFSLNATTTTNHA